MSKPIDYKLTKDELMAQIHRTLRELYRDRLMSPEEILDNLVEDNYGISFMAYNFAEINVIEPDEMIRKLYIELGIEFEKNLHDKFYFVMKIGRAHV